MAASPGPSWTAGPAAQRVRVVGEAGGGDAADLPASACPRRLAAVLAIVAVEADQLAQEDERADLSGRCSAAWHQLAEQDRVAAVAGGAQRGVTGEIELAVDRRRLRNAVRALRAEPRVEVRLVPHRPDAHVRELPSHGLREEAELLRAGARGAGSAPAVGGPSRRVAADAHVGPHAGGNDRVHRGGVGAPVVARGVACVESGGLTAARRRHVAPIELDLHNVRAERGELRRRGVGLVEHRAVVLDDQQLAVRRLRGGSRHGCEHDKDERESFHSWFPRSNTGQARGCGRCPC